VWSDLQREAAARLARLHLVYSHEPSPYAERLLNAALQAPHADADAKPKDDWENRARSLYVLALARNGKPAAALALVSQLANAPAESLIEVLDGIDQTLARTRNPDATAQQQLGRLAGGVVTLLDSRKLELSDEAQKRLGAYRAAAQAAAGDRAGAIASYTELSRQWPEDGTIQERSAQLLAASDSANEQREALAIWLVVEQRSRLGGPRWRRARQARIELLNRLGAGDEADKLLRLTRLLYPYWDAASKSR
jgi:hypothetical protein